MVTSFSSITRTDLVYRLIKKNHGATPVHTVTEWYDWKDKSCELGDTLLGAGGGRTLSQISDCYPLLLCLGLIRNSWHSHLFPINLQLPVTLFIPTSSCFFNSTPPHSACFLQWLPRLCCLWLLLFFYLLMLRYD